MILYISMAEEAQKLASGESENDEETSDESSNSNIEDY